MTIYGIGTDLCDVRRIRETLARRGDRFAERVLGPQELAVFHHRRAQAPGRAERYLATRFAAKEALSKAIGLGLRPPMTWQSCEVLNGPLGEPQLQLHGALAAWFLERGLRAHVSLTDETDQAMSFVVVEHHAPAACPPGPLPASPSRA